MSGPGSGLEFQVSVEIREVKKEKNEKKEARGLENTYKMKVGSSSWTSRCLMIGEGKKTMTKTRHTCMAAYVRAHVRDNSKISRWFKQK